MHDFKDTVPFDPGFSPLSFSFIENIAILNQDFSKQKANHQKKFWLIKNEAQIVDLIKKTSAFYLGCILWGGFLSNRFKTEPKKIEGNSTEKMSEEQLKELDCAVEVKFMLEYIKNFNRDLKYFVGRTAKIDNFITEVLEGYIEFAQINKNFIGINYTNEIKVPNAISHFTDYNDEKLDNLSEKIYEIIKSAKIEKLLELGFYK